MSAEIEIKVRRSQTAATANSTLDVEHWAFDVFKFE